MQSCGFKNVKLFWERTHSEPPFLQTLSMTVEINEKKLYYNYNTSGKFLTLKYKFQVTSSDPPTSDASLHPCGPVYDIPMIFQHAWEQLYRGRSSSVNMLTSDCWEQ
jgi:hypothetical protein